MRSLDDVLKGAGVDPSTLRHSSSSVREGIRLASVHGREAVDVWRRLRALVDESGHWPVLLGHDEDLSRVEEAQEGFEEQSLEQILTAAESIDAQTFLKERRAEQLEYGEAPRGEWPEEAAHDHRFYIPGDPKPHSRVHLALVPTTIPWVLPAHLCFGGWNECPFPAEHVAVFKAWHEEYGAEVVGISGDVVEMAVARPPRDHDGALKLALDQYAYCADIVDQGTETIDALAASLLNAEGWFFWWD
jgi:hypothetical protein